MLSSTSINAPQNLLGFYCSKLEVLTASDHVRPANSSFFFMSDVLVPQTDRVLLCVDEFLLPVAAGARNRGAARHRAQGTLIRRGVSIARR